MRAAVRSLDSSLPARRQERKAEKPALLVLLAHRRGFWSVQILLARLRLSHRPTIEEDGDGDEEVRFTVPAIDGRPFDGRERLRGSSAPLG